MSPSLRFKLKVGAQAKNAAFGITRSKAKRKRDESTTPRKSSHVNAKVFERRGIDIAK